MKQVFVVLIGCVLLVLSCSPKITTRTTRTYDPLDYREEVRVYALQEPAPASAELLGSVRIGDTGFSTNCGWGVVIEKAKLEARKIGGNAIKITEHNPPSAMGSTCHRITASILKVENIEDIPVADTDDLLGDVDYALLHVYRNSGMGALVSYDLHWDDSVICRVSNRWKKTIKIKKEGAMTLWARTEAKEELPLEIRFGNEYYVRCAVTMGAFVGHPSLELVDSSTGAAEFQSIVPRKSAQKDLIILNNDKEVECVITGEDETNVYFTIIRNGKKVNTQAKRSDIKSIERAE